MARTLRADDFGTTRRSAWTGDDAAWRLEAPSGRFIGQRIIVQARALAGVLTITGADECAMLSENGDAVEFVVTLDDNGKKIWKLIGHSAATSLKGAA